MELFGSRPQQEGVWIFLNDGNDPMKDMAPRVLMLCPSFFGYSQLIAQELNAQGYQVDLYDERPGNGFFDKTLIRLNCSLYHPVILRYYTRIIEENRDKNYDYVFVIKGEAVTPAVLSALRGAYPAAKFLLYLWDSVENNPDCANRMKQYDRVMTFDLQDAKHYGIGFRPLFFKQQPVPFCEPDAYVYDAAFVGTAHSIRPKVVYLLQQACAVQGRSVFSYFYAPHPAVYWFRKLTNRAFRYLRPSEVHYTPLSAAEINGIYEKTRCILDVEHIRQRGLTMRTIEVLGMGKKLITTNTQIKEYDFYSPDNVCVIDRDHPEVSDAFWTSPYRPISAEILARYTLRSFVQEIFSC